MNFKSFDPGIEVNGQTVFSIVDGLGEFKTLAKRVLLDSGIGTEENGELKMDLNAWYPQDSWLHAFEIFSNEIGDTLLKNIGMKIPENAQFPHWVEDIDSAIKSIDIAYHMNHRKDGKPLYDMETGKMTEGIGHYGYERIPGKNLIISESINPYPCAFDFGIISAMAAKFKPNSIVEHHGSKPCRKKGADSCTYLVSW